MNKDAGILPSGTETIAELRDLYREAEGRAARMRLISVSERALAEADLDSLDEILDDCGERLAFFVGSRGAAVHHGKGDGGFPLKAPGPDGENLGSVAIDGLDSIDAIADPEDREAVRMQLDLMGAAIDRLHKEREKSDLLAALQDREKSLEMLVERIFTAQEEERRRVSHELHDGVAQTATALVRILEGAEANGTAAPDDAGGPRPAEIARSLVSELRRVIGGLRPTLLDDLGLVPALRSLAENLESDGCSVTLRLDGFGERVSPLAETALFRVAQEAVSNIRKHAGVPCDVIIEAKLDTETGERLLRITDFGKGPSAKTRSGSLDSGKNIGIEVMKERMAGIGGTLDWKPGPKGGVVVEARVKHEP